MTSLIHNIGGIITYDLKAEDVITSNVDSILIKNNHNILIELMNSYIEIYSYNYLTKNQIHRLYV